MCIYIQAANLAGFRASEDPRFEAGIPDFMNGILNFTIHFNVVHRKVDWRNPKMKSLNSMPDIYIIYICQGRDCNRVSLLVESTLLTYIYIYVRTYKIEIQDPDRVTTQQ